MVDGRPEAHPGASLGGRRFLGKSQSWDLPATGQFPVAPSGPKGPPGHWGGNQDGWRSLEPGVAWALGQHDQGD